MQCSVSIIIYSAGLELLNFCYYSFVYNSKRQLKGKLNIR